MYNSDSFWGAQWTIATLWPLAYPQIASDMGNSLLQYYKDSGFIPRGPSGGQDTLVMTGSPTTPFLVSNYQKGLRDFDIELAYQAMKKNHSLEGVMARAGQHEARITRKVDHLAVQGGEIDRALCA